MAFRRLILMEQRLAALATAMTESGAILGARSRAKTNEYLHSIGRRNRPSCARCGSYRYDAAVSGPDVDKLCGPTYCAHA